MCCASFLNLLCVCILQSLVCSDFAVKFIAFFSSYVYCLKALSFPYSISALLPTLWVCALRDGYCPLLDSFHLGYFVVLHSMCGLSEDGEISLSNTTGLRFMHYSFYMYVINLLSIILYWGTILKTIMHYCIDIIGINCIPSMDDHTTDFFRIKLKHSGGWC